MTATFATFFVGRDAANGKAELAALSFSKGEGVLAVPSPLERERGRVKGAQDAEGAFMNRSG